MPLVAANAGADRDGEGHMVFSMRDRRRRLLLTVEITSDALSALGPGSDEAIRDEVERLASAKYDKLSLAADGRVVVTYDDILMDRRRRI